MGTGGEGITLVEHARRRDEAPPDHDLAAVAAGAAEIRDRAGAMLARAEALLAAAGQDAPPPPWVTPRQIALLAAGLRHAGSGAHAIAEQAGVLAARAAADDVTLALARATGFRDGVSAAGGGRHRASRPRKPYPGQLRLLTGGMSGVAAGAAVLRHKAVMGGAAAAVTAATVSTAGIARLPDYVKVPVAQHGAATSAALPSPGPGTAVPVALPPLPAGYVPGRHARAGVPDADAATRMPSRPPLVVLAPPPPPPPAPPARPSASPSGTLDVATVTCAIGPAGTGQIVFTAAGGPLSWSASPSSPALSIDGPGAGVLAGGQPFILTVRVRPGTPAGTAAVTVTAGGQQENVQVLWDSVPG